MTPNLMKTDHLFYRLFKELPSSFFELIGCSVSQARSYRFESVELKQTVLEEGRAEGELQAKFKTVPRLLKRGFSLEEVAEILELDLEQVRQAAQEN